jgi:hypothetical protein
MPARHPGAMTTNQTNEAILEFRAPPWAGDWCAKCEWQGTCTDCRAGWT